MIMIIPISGGTRDEGRANVVLIGKCSRHLPGFLARFVETLKMLTTEPFFTTLLITEMMRQAQTIRVTFLMETL